MSTSPETPLVELRIVIPAELYRRLERLEQELGVTKEDIITRALVKVLEELGG